MSLKATKTPSLNQALDLLAEIGMPGVTPTLDVIANLFGLSFESIRIEVLKRNEMHRHANALREIERLSKPAEVACDRAWEEHIKRLYGREKSPPLSSLPPTLKVFDDAPDDALKGSAWEAAEAEDARDMLKRSAYDALKGSAWEGIIKASSVIGRDL